MKNLMPTCQGRADAPSDAFNKLTAREPEKSDAPNPMNVLYGLGVDMSAAVFEQRYLKNAPALSDHIASAEQVYVTATFRHELRAFDFVLGPIGMEIEYKFRRLLCTNVMPYSQASTFAELLEGSEVVAIYADSFVTSSI